MVHCQSTSTSPCRPCSLVPGNIFVVRQLRNNLLGLSAITALQLIQRINATHQVPADILEQFPKVFTGLGTLGGDYTIKLKEDKPVPFNKLPFGIFSAPELLQRRMNSILGGLEGVVCLMDDVLVYGEDEAEHDARLL